MKAVKRRRTRDGALVPFSLRPRKKYPFKTPIPPGSVVRIKKAARSPWKKKVGQWFRIGYYSWQDGLDCIWLVNKDGKYQETLDHDYLYKFFEIENVAKERSLYGRGKAKLGPLKEN